ncbi:MAG: hypothetical protein IH948_02700 [Bacteroidetes bacterium]|nr:hypothetical protein [Bacteroidota bacterium]
MIEHSSTESDEGGAGGESLMIFKLNNAFANSNASFVTENPSCPHARRALTSIAQSQ